MKISKSTQSKLILLLINILLIIIYIFINNFDFSTLLYKNNSINWSTYWVVGILGNELLILLMSIVRFTRGTQVKISVTIISILFIIFYFSSNPINFQQILNSNTPINWNYFWIGTLLAFLSNLLDGLAWHRILIFLDKRITKRDGVINHLVGFSLGIFIPVAGTAELASKSVMLTKKYPGFTSEETISSIAAIRTVFLITAYVAWGFLIVSLGMAGVLTPLETIVILVVVWIILTAVIYILISFFGNVNRLSSALKYMERGSLKHHKIHSIFDVIKSWLENFSKSFNQIKKMSRKEIIVMMILVFSQNFIKWVSVYFIYLAVLNLPFYVVMFISVAIGFVNLIPAGIPGLAGLREIATIIGLDVFVKNKDQVVLSTLLQSASLYLFFLVAFIVGLPYWLLLKPVKEERAIKNIDEEGVLNKNKIIENADPVRF